ncbi:MAG: hypothetical protein LBI57_05695 [Helicobacteraceae bacterium]|jgi:hypothetical protein|nr:hypothetical protein [Helicobacteraceae bacterium]
MNQTRKWNDKLKVAIVNEEIETIARLQGETPTDFDDPSDARESAALIAEAIRLLKDKRERLQTEIEQNQKAIAYQRSQIGLNAKRYETIG